MLDKVFMNNLFDFYGDLLTEKQQEICRYYYAEDYSLQEIRDICNITRSAVYDMINRSRKDLLYYEEKLHCYAQFQKRNAVYQKILQSPSLTDDIREYIKECIEIENEEET